MNSSRAKAQVVGNLRSAGGYGRPFADQKAAPQPRKIGDAVMEKRFKPRKRRKGHTTGASSLDPHPTSPNVCTRDMGNGCARTWVTPRRHAEPPAGGGQDALAGGYPDVVARGVCAVGAAGWS